MQMNGRKQNKGDQRRQQHRTNLFGDVPDDQLWSNSLKGWCWMPRTMPLILLAIRGMSKGSSAADTYLALWCNSFSGSIVEMKDRAGMIAAAGYTGATAERTWKERMLKLAELGFIKIAPGKHGDISCVLILNPHLVLKRHKEKRTPGFDERIFNCILEGTADYGMMDFEQPKKSTKLPVPPPPPPPRNPGPPPRSQFIPPPTVGRSRSSRSVVIAKANKARVKISGGEVRKLKRKSRN
jgi:hypothetical protein